MNTQSSFLLSQIEEAARQMGIAPSTLCQRAVNNSKLPIRLQGGASVTLATVGKLQAYIVEHSPRVYQRGRGEKVS